MKTRLITAAVGVPFLIFVLIVRGWFAELVTALLTTIARWAKRATTSAHGAAMRRRSRCGR